MNLHTSIVPPYTPDDHLALIYRAADKYADFYSDLQDGITIDVDNAAFDVTYEEHFDADVGGTDGMVADVEFLCLKVGDKYFGTEELIDLLGKEAAHQSIAQACSNLADAENIALRDGV